MTSVIKRSFPLTFHWETQDPFLFLAHHRDLYPEGNSQMGPNVPLKGRNIGNDFDLSNAFKMYHGHVVPGFPEHPHRGFETVTLVLEGYVDHFDSFGASGRYGDGDVQWMTAGKGMQHCEMFPCVHMDKPNPLELFQIWLNLPQAKKFVDPYYKMLWAEEVSFKDVFQGHVNVGAVKLISGSLLGLDMKCPAPDSLASESNAEIVIALIEVSENSTLKIEDAHRDVERTLYYYSGEGAEVNGDYHKAMTGFMIDSGEVTLKSGNSPSKFLLLQGKPLNEPVVAYGPFVMNTRQEIAQAYDDYQKTQFGGWPWDRSDPVHTSDVGRIAKYPDGSLEKPDLKSDQD